MYAFDLQFVNSTPKAMFIFVLIIEKDNISSRKENLCVGKSTAMINVVLKYHYPRKKCEEKNICFVIIMNDVRLSVSLP